MYKENARILTLLDDKAQKTAGLSGVFIAAAFSFLKLDTLESLYKSLGVQSIVLLAIALATLVLCMVFAGLVIWTRKLRTPPNPNSVLATVNQLLSLNEELDDETRENHVRDQAESWNRSLQVQDAIITDKPRRLLISQCFLFASIFVVMWLFATFLVRAVS